MLLSELKNNEKGTIVKVKGRGAFRKRITEMGFVKGKEVVVVKSAPLKDPVQYSLMGYEISLRRSEAALIEVVTAEEAERMAISEFNGVLSEENLRETVLRKEKIINVALVGNPNAGKTTFFNYASGSHEHVGNYSGVTVDAKMAQLKLDDYTFNIVDLPGTYSLTAYSPEELYVRQYIVDNVPDMVINIVDASNLERNLYLTTQLIDMGINVVMALNMYDELQKRGDNLDYEALGDLLGITICPTVSSKGKGVKELFLKSIEIFEDRSTIQRHVHINYGQYAEKAIKNIQKNIKTPENQSLTDKVSSRFLAVKLVEKDKHANDVIKQCANYETVLKVAQEQIHTLENELNEDSETIITDAKYGFINGAIKETFKEGAFTKNRGTEIIDTILTHKVFSFPIFITFIWFMFQVTFSLGSYPMDWIDKLVHLFSDFLSNTMPDGMLKDLVIDGIIGGVGGVIVFLPNILLLFFFISLMEDTGYMARAAFIMDKLMHKIGLHGKSFIPLIMGFGCGVPAVMATRTLENRNDRLMTMLINPFMSCSARLPVYILLIGAFFPKHSGTVLFTIYFTGIAVAVFVAVVLKKTIFKSKQAPFVMELPPYRMPTLKTTFRHMWDKGSEYLKKMGGVILIASVIVWALGYFPHTTKNTQKFDLQLLETQKLYTQKLSLIKDTTQIRVLNDEKEHSLNQITVAKRNDQQENSFIGYIGKAIAPVLKPLGFDWRMGVSLLTGATAKEIVVSTLGVLYQAENDADENSESLKEILRKQTHSSGELKGQKVFSPLIAFAFMIFVLIYMPCIATVAAIKRESGHWKWALFMVGYSTVLAWLMSFLIYQIGKLIGF